MFRVESITFLTGVIRIGIFRMVTDFSLEFFSRAQYKSTLMLVGGLLLLRTDSEELSAYDMFYLHPRA